VPFNTPSPDPESKRKSSSGLNSLVQAERLMQIAFVLPCAMLLGWAAGWAVDHYFHLHWAVAVGLVLGIVAGMVSAIRMAMDAMKPTGGSK
jgi:ATP synthase protein I